MIYFLADSTSTTNITIRHSSPSTTTTSSTILLSKTPKKHHQKQNDFYNHLGHLYFFIRKIYQ
ncbi:hypothetical protein PP707_01945 [Acetobacter pasteurianus]|nr:hypothetical protein [Acetobacter pasteurianus]